MWNPGISYHGDQYYHDAITGAANTLSSAVQGALQRYEEGKKQREFNTGILDTMKDLRDSSGNPYVPVEALARWDALNGDKQAGVIAGAARRMNYDLQQQAGTRSQQQIDLERQRLTNENEPFTPQADDFDAARRAGGELVETQPGRYQFLPYGSGSNNFTPPKDMIERGRAIGQEWLQTGPNQGVWREDPNNAANLGTTDAKPVKDPRDPTKIIGLEQSNGTIKYFRRPSDMEAYLEQRGAGSRQQLPANGGSDAAAPSLMPGIGEIRRGYKFKGGDPSKPDSWEKTEPRAPVAGAPSLTQTGQDQQALQWARANPTDPRSAAILKKLGLAQ